MGLFTLQCYNMFGLTSFFTLALAASIATGAVLQPRRPDHLTIPLRQHQGNARPAALVNHVASKYSHQFGRSHFTIEPETLDAGFWYGAFDVGQSKNLSLLIDTGSNDVSVNPGLYKPSGQSKNLNQTGHLRYSTTQENGCGVADVDYNVYTDVVSMHGLVAHNQTFANVVKTKPPNNGTITQFPHQGIVGFAGTKPNETQLNGLPFFQSLCNQGQVKECRFGLAYGTSGKGSQILGGVDQQLIEGKLSTAPLEQDSEWLLKGSVTINGTAVEKSQNIILDSGTANVGFLCNACSR